MQEPLLFDSLNKIYLGKFLIEFEKTTLQQIRDFIGSGSIEHLGEDEESQYWICYSQSGQLIWFMSQGKMGGKNHTITQVAVAMTDPDDRTEVQKTEIPPHAQPINTSFGWVGISKEAIKKILGQPSNMQNNSVMHYYSDTKPGKNNGINMAKDVMIYIEVEIAKDKVIAISASLIPSD